MEEIEYTFEKAKELTLSVRDTYGKPAALARMHEVGVSHINSLPDDQVKPLIDGILKIYPHFREHALRKGVYAEAAKKLYEGGTPPLVQTNETPPAPPSAYMLITDAANTVLQRAADRDVEEERSMRRCVESFNALTGHSVSERDGWLFMVVLKMARATSTPTGRIDDYVDASAYCGLAGECAAKAGAL
jgi:hypothetical protein